MPDCASNHDIGSPVLGEIFNPAEDCSDVVDQLPEAENGFYWISLSKGTKHKVCSSRYYQSLGDSCQLNQFELCLNTLRENRAQHNSIPSLYFGTVELKTR